MPRTAKRQPNGQAADYDRQPIQAPRNQPYGERKQLVDAQKAVPLANLRPDIQASQQAAEVESYNPFAGVTPLAAPTRYPSEPVTTGLAVGAGAGPEILRGRPQGTLADGLRLLAEATGDPEIRAMAMEALSR